MSKGKFTRELRRVKREFDGARLTDICERDESQFWEFGKVTDCGPGFFYIYRDNGADILAIAHLDTVQDKRDTSIVETKAGQRIVFSPALDDRLGAYVILDLLPRLGIKVDVLLTTGEESACSTGVDFARAHVAASGKQYKWMFQFDRTGTDVVMYDYDNPDSRKQLRTVGFKPAQGLFSDISDMGCLGCIGFNFGVGYRDYHSPRAYAWLDDTFAQVARFLLFHKRYGAQAMPYTEPQWMTGSYTDSAGKEHTYHYKRQPRADYWEEPDWESVRDRYLSKQPTPGMLDYSDAKCICDHIESWHDGTGGECVYHSCGCPAFVPTDLAETQEQALIGV